MRRAASFALVLGFGLAGSDSRTLNPRAALEWIREEIK
jgi:hypothetical protein